MHIDRITDSLTAYLKLRGIDAKAIFEPAEDESVDDQIAFKTSDGKCEYPVAIQLGDSSCCVVTYQTDARGELSSRHGLMHTFTSPADNTVAYEVWQALKTSEPAPVQTAE